MSKPNERKWRVLARDRKTNDVRQVYLKPGGQFTVNSDAKDRRSLLTRKEATAAVNWADKERNAAGYATTSRWPFLVLDSDTAWGNPKLANKLNELCRQLRRYGWCGEFKRTAQRQWYFYQGYLQRKPGFNLAAPCCSKNYVHSWAACGKTPRSNHAAGNACDFSILHSGRGGAYTNVGRWGNDTRGKMKALGLALPVGGEPWHAEISNVWRA